MYVGFAILSMARIIGISMHSGISYVMSMKSLS